MQTGKGGGSRFGSPLLQGFSRRRVDQTRRTASTVPEGLLCSSWTLLGPFCNFHMFEYVFKFLLNVFSLCYVVKIVTEKHSEKVMWKCVFVFLFIYVIEL